MIVLGYWSCAFWYTQVITVNLLHLEPPLFSLSYFRTLFYVQHLTIYNNSQKISQFDFRLAEKHFPSHSLTLAFLVRYLLKYIHRTIFLPKWETSMGCSGERSSILCFWSLKQEKEAADIDPEPNRIALELSEAMQNASGKVIFQKCLLISFPLLAPPPHRHSSFTELLMPRLCPQRKQCFPS